MKSNLPALPLRLLVLGALCATSLTAMADSSVANDSFEGLSHARQAWWSDLGRAGWADERRSFGAVHFGEHHNSMSFADVARERISGLAGVGELARDGRHDVWSGDVMSDGGASNPLAGVTAPVPEPETYVLMMVGLAIFGFIMRRRRRS